MVAYADTGFLVSLYLPRPIRDDHENREATEMMNGPTVFEKLDAEQNDSLDVLIEFVDACDKAQGLGCAAPCLSTSRPLRARLLAIRPIRATLHVGTAPFPDRQHPNRST
jgi:hypothetical protein